MTALEHGIREARRIRRNLVRLRGDTSLVGDCALASLLLADAIGSPASLRGSSDKCADPCVPHVWNVIDGVIVDITATQFNDDPARGVLVTKKPRTFHRPVYLRGRQVFDHILADVGDYASMELNAALKRLAARIAA